MKRKLLASAFVIGICSAATLTYAGKKDLTIVNQTNYDSTSRIHTMVGTVCSADILKEGGITRKGTTKVIPENSLKIACLGSSDKCIADVYMTDNCSGEVIANAALNLTAGKVLYVNMTQQGNTLGYKIAISGPMTIVASGGPA